MNSGLTSHQQRGHTETGPRFKVSSERPEKRGIDLALTLYCGYLVKVFAISTAFQEFAFIAKCCPFTSTMGARTFSSITYKQNKIFENMSVRKGA